MASESTGEPTPDRRYIAVAHAVLRTIYHVLASGHEYHNLGPDYYERRDTDRVRQRAVAAR